MAKVDKSKKVTKEAAVFKNLFSSDYVRWIEKEAEILAMSQGPWLSKEEASVSVDLAADKISKALKTGVDAEVARIVNGVREDILEVMIEENGGTMVQSKKNASLKDELKNLLGLGMSEEEITDTLVEEGFDKAEVKGLFSELGEKQPFDVNSGLREELKNLQDLGLSKEEIVESLKEEGFSEEELNEALVPKPAPVGNKKMAGLAGEVKNLQDLGLSKEEIMESLLGEGFSPEELEQAFSGEPVPAKGQMMVGKNKKVRAIKEGWDKMERIRELMGEDALLDEIMRAMSGKELEEMADWIIRMHDLSSEFPEDIEEEEEDEIEEDASKMMVGKNKKVRTGTKSWDKMEHIRKLMGESALLDEIMTAMSGKELEEMADWIIQMHDLSSEFPEDIKEEEEDEIEEDASKIKLSKLDKDAALNLKPLGSNMTAVTVGNWKILFSYETPVAAINLTTGEALKTEQRFSNTTTRHVNKFLDGKEAVEVPQGTIADLVG